ncbi:mechanosensitive ion channel [bacterium]|nr:mechanosensitive ion channel [bacterium]
MQTFFKMITPDFLSDFFANHILIRMLFDFIAVSILAFILTFVARKIVDVIIKFTVTRTKTKWDDVFFRHGVFSKFVNMVPALVFFWSASSFERGSHWLKKLSFCIIIIVFMDIIRAANKAMLEIYDSFEISKDRPLKGLMQIILIVIYCVGLIAIVSILLDKSPALLLSGLGAMTAVIMLIFRDTILGFVAGLQIAANNSIRKGDWIVMPQNNADGEVVDIALHTVKIQNWDKTIANIPTHKFLEESFTNWRGMVESGGRRICRDILIDVSSIRCLTDEEIAKFSRIELLSDYMKAKTAEISSWNAKVNAEIPVNTRRLTNIGTFREYARRYLLNNDKLRQDLTLLVRFSDFGEHGIPLQIYAFTKTTELAEYEAVQADIFDHLIATAGFFGLTLYQQPGWHDIQVLAENFKGK